MSRPADDHGPWVVADDRRGINAIIGTAIASLAVPGGHTALIVPAEHAITPMIQRRLPCDAMKHLEPVWLNRHGA